MKRGAMATKQPWAAAPAVAAAASDTKKRIKNYPGLLTDTAYTSSHQMRQTQRLA